MSKATPTRTPEDYRQSWEEHVKELTRLHWNLRGAESAMLDGAIQTLNDLVRKATARVAQEAAQGAA